MHQVHARHCVLLASTLDQFTMSKRHKTLLQFFFAAEACILCAQKTNQLQSLSGAQCAAVKSHRLLIKLILLVNNVQVEQDLENGASSCITVFLAGVHHAIIHFLLCLQVYSQGLLFIRFVVACLDVSKFKGVSHDDQ